MTVPVVIFKKAGSGFCQIVINNFIPVYLNELFRSGDFSDNFTIAFASRIEFNQ